MSSSTKRKTVSFPRERQKREPAQPQVDGEDGSEVLHPRMQLQATVRIDVFRSTNFSRMLYYDRQLNENLEPGVFKSGSIVSVYSLPSSHRSFARLDAIRFVDLKQSRTTRGKERPRLFMRRQIPKRHGQLQSDRPLVKLMHPFIPRLLYAWHDARNLWMIEDRISLGRLLPQQPQAVPALVALYMAELLVLVEFVHRQGMILRDVGPNDILLTRHGHLRVNDVVLKRQFLAAYGERLPRDPENFLAAPEVQDRTMGKVTEACDYWMIGAFALRLLTGFSEFRGMTKRAQFESKLPPVYPVELEDSKDKDKHKDKHKDKDKDGARLGHLKELIGRLLVVEPADRLTEPELIRKHPVFHDLDWGSLESQRRQQSAVWALPQLPDPPADRPTTMGDYEQQVEPIDQLGSSILVKNKKKHQEQQRLSHVAEEKEPALTPEMFKGISASIGPSPARRRGSHGHRSAPAAVQARRRNPEPSGRRRTRSARVVESIGGDSDNDRDDGDAIGTQRLLPPETHEQLLAIKSSGQGDGKPSTPVPSNAARESPHTSLADGDVKVETPRLGAEAMLERNGSSVASVKTLAAGSVATLEKMDQIFDVNEIDGYTDQGMPSVASHAAVARHYDSEESVSGIPPVRESEVLSFVDLVSDDDPPSVATTVSPHRTWAANHADITRDLVFSDFSIVPDDMEAIDRFGSLSDNLFVKRNPSSDAWDPMLIERQTEQEQEPFPPRFVLRRIRKKTLEKNTRERYQHEYLRLLAFDHPFITRLVYAFHDDTFLYAATEYIVGTTLARRIEPKQQLPRRFKTVPLPLDQVRLYIAQLVVALRDLHAAEVVYRDLQPQNILIDCSGYIRLTNYGVSKRTLNLYDPTQAMVTPAIATGKHRPLGQTNESPNKVLDGLATTPETGRRRRRSSTDSLRATAGQQRLSRSRSRGSSQSNNTDRRRGSAASGDRTGVRRRSGSMKTPPVPPRRGSAPGTPKMLKVGSPKSGSSQVRDPIADANVSPSVTATQAPIGAGTKQQFTPSSLGRASGAHAAATGGKAAAMAGRTHRRTSSFLLHAGHELYMAPEILQIDKTKRNDTLFGMACDWWSLGVLTYQLVYGRLPFDYDEVGPNRFQVYDLIINEPFCFPTDWTVMSNNDKEANAAELSALHSFISGCLTKNPKDRLGSHFFWFDRAVMLHPFFHSLNMKDIGKKQDPKPQWIPDSTDVAVEAAVKKITTNRDGDASMSMQLLEQMSDVPLSREP